MEKTVKFTPLRRVKKTGKIVVAGYLQWRKVKTADYGLFDLVIQSAHQNFPKDEFVYNHKGEQLFWFDHQNPEALPKNNVSIQSISETFGIPIEYLEGEEWKISEPVGSGFHYSVRGFDCDGVPVFSHNTADYIATHYSKVNEFVPLTVGMVVKWYGWFLWQLNNSKLVTP